MFAPLSTLALSFLIPFASALTIQTPTDWTSGGPVIVNLTTSAGDPSVFSLELSNPLIFNAALALQNNVDSSLQSISFTLPSVPPTSGYTLQAVNVSNINQIYGESGSFSIGATVSSSIPSSSSALSTSGSAASSGTGSSVTVVPTTIHSSTFGVTLSNTNTAPSSSKTGATGSAGTSSSGSSSPSPSSFNGAASMSNFGLPSWVVMGLGAVFGGVVAF